MEVSAIDGGPFRLTDQVGARVLSPAGESLGRLIELTVELGEEHPPVRRLVVSRGHPPGARMFANWSDVQSYTPDDVRVDRAALQASDLDVGELRLVRDVLDTQVLDVVGKRLARVSEVFLVDSEATVRVAGVDVGAAGIWRRLGLPWLAKRISSRFVDWPDLHPVSARGHALALAKPGAGVHRFAPAELAVLLTHLPLDRGAEALDTVRPAIAAEALVLSHPRVGAELLEALPKGKVTSIMALLPPHRAARVRDGIVVTRRARGRRFVGVRRPHRRRHQADE